MCYYEERAKHTGPRTTSDKGLVYVVDNPKSEFQECTSSTNVYDLASSPFDYEASQ